MLEQDFKLIVDKLLEKIDNEIIKNEINDNRARMILILKEMNDADRYIAKAKHYLFNGFEDSDIEGFIGMAEDAEINDLHDPDNIRDLYRKYGKKTLKNVFDIVTYVDKITTRKLMEIKASIKYFKPLIEGIKYCVDKDLLPLKETEYDDLF